MNKLGCLIFLFVGFSHYTFSQDSLSTDLSKKKLSISAYFTPSFFYLEPGIQVQYFLKDNSYLEFKYGFSIFTYNAFNTGLLNFDKKNNWEGYGSIIRFGYRYLRKGYYAFTNYKIHEYRITYKDLFFPAYEFADGSTGLDETTWYHQSERRRVLVLNYVVGSKISETGKFRLEYTAIMGFAIMKCDYTRYYYYVGNDPTPRPMYPGEELKTEFFPRPSIGFGFTFYFKAYGNIPSKTLNLHPDSTQEEKIDKE